MTTTAKKRTVVSREVVAESKHQLVISAVVESVIKRHLDAMTPRARRKHAADIRWATRELRKTVADLRSYVSLLDLTNPDDIIEAIPSCLDELQEDSCGTFLDMSRGEAKMVLLSVLHDIGVDITAKHAKVIASHDAAKDRLAPTLKQRIKTGATYAMWSTLITVVVLAATVGVLSIYDIYPFWFSVK